MNGTEKRGLSLSIKFFLLTAFIILLLIGVTLLFSQRRATALANETIRAGLEETLSTFDSFQADRYSKLKMINNVIAQNPYIIAYVEQADTLSILDQARQRQQELRSDFIIVTDSEGTILARTDRPTASGQNIAELPLVSQALEGEEVSGLWVEGSNMYNAVVLPLIQQETLVACLAVGYAINDALAGEIRNLTHSETAIFLTPKGAETTLVATTQSGMKEALTQAFQTGGGSSDPFRFRIGPENHIGVVRQIKNPDGATMAAFMAFRSLDRELFGFRQFQKNILIVGVGIMVLAFLISFLGARRITEPLRHLTEVINEVKEGNYEVDIDVHSADEVGILANSFRRLLSELKEKAQLVQYLSTQPTMSSGTGAMAPTVAHQQEQQATLPIGATHQSTGGTLASLGPGSVIAGRYEVQSVLGSGGMGVVLKARDRQLDEIVALKMLKGEVFTSDPAALERFKQELKLARRITHRHVVRTFDYAELDNYYVISMEYVKGITLKQLVRQRGMLPLKIAVQIGKQICSALDAAHEKGVVHRDIKPQNILLESSGDVKIMDFGIARVADMKGMTSTGTVMGTPDYMSPEQAQGIEMDLRTDIYSTGVVLFEIFTGKLPFTADSALAVLNKHVREQPPRPTSINPNIPPELEGILLKAMAKNPDQRYQKIQELYDELDRISVMLSRTAA